MAKLILLACQPKSGSTFLSNYLANVGGGRPYSFVPGYGRREQELSELRLLRGKIRRNRFLVGQHHVRCSDETLRLIHRFDISVVVLYRNLFDAVASMRDHIRRESYVAPMFYLDKDMLGLPDRDLEVALARFAVPWYLNFYMSWRDYNDAIFVDFDQIRTDAQGTAEGILKSFGLSPTASKVEVDEVRKSSRFNSGLSGRGASIAPEAIEIIKDQLRFYLQFVDDDYLGRHIE
jgi:hypothetical protein